MTVQAPLREDLDRTAVGSEEVQLSPLEQHSGTARMDLSISCSTVLIRNGELARVDYDWGWRCATRVRPCSPMWPFVTAERHSCAQLCEKYTVDTWQLFSSVRTLSVFGMAFQQQQSSGPSPCHTRSQC